MNLSAVCFDIVNTPVEHFERLVTATRASSDVFHTFAEATGSEIVPLATCNRCEFYLGHPGRANFSPASRDENMGSAIPAMADSLLVVLAEVCGCPVSQLREWASIQQDVEVVRHLFETTTGLHSIAVGESQIQGQVKDAYARARASGLVGGALAPLYEAALHAGKRARTESGLQEARISLGNLAIRSLQDSGAFAEGVSVVIIGTGKMARNAADYFVRNRISRELVFLSYHPAKRAPQLACFHAKVCHMDTLREHLTDADLIFSAYGTEELVLTRDHLRDVVDRRENPLYLIDVGMPRDIDPAAVELPNVRLINFCELKKLRNSDRIPKSAEIAAAERIIANEIENFLEEQKLLIASSAISLFRSQAETLRRKELSRTLNRLSHLEEEDKAAIQKLTYNLLNKVLNPPTVKIKEKTVSGQLDERDIRLIRDIFS